MAYTTINDPSAYFTTLLYTGNATDNRNLTNDANAGDFKPDLLWLKERSSTSSHQMVDSIRGTTPAFLVDSGGAEDDDANRVQAFQTNGFQVGTASTVNQNTITMVAWQWKCNGGTATATVSESGNNPAATVQANTDAGFSIVTYTGTGAVGTVPHGLGAAPDLIHLKKRTGEGWVSYWNVSVFTGENGFLGLNSTGGFADSAGEWNDTAPTSSVFTVGTQDRVNTNDGVYMAYCFKSIQGYSKIGSYTGNGNANGAFVYTGFKPAWILFKQTQNTGGWTMKDNTRSPANPAIARNLADASSAENTGADIDFLSNGFKCRHASNAINATENYIYMAFAERPFVTSTGTPTTAR